jgi:hypothetical protein
MRLEELVDEYRTIRRLSPGAAYLMRRTVTLYGVFLTREATTADLTDLSVSSWLEHLERVCAAWTRTGHRTRILGLWRFGAKRLYCLPPGEVRRAPAPEPMPTAWT